MSLREHSPLKGRLFGAPLISYFVTLFKFKLLKSLLKLAVLLGVIWLMSGTWFGGKLVSFLKSSSGGLYSILAYVVISFKLLAVASLIVILTKVIIGKPLPKLLFILVGIGLIALLFEHFIF